MGVKGLWQLLQPTGHPVTLESLEGKVLTVDVSIWLNQTIKGMRDKDGNPLPNAHLLGLFHRVCKLLFYRIKPIFVFDGGVPALKKQTLIARRQRKEFAANKSDRAAKDILENLLKHHALNAVLSTPGGSTPAAPVPSTSQQQKPDLFELPPMPVPLEQPVVVDEGFQDWEERMDQRSVIHAEFQNLDDIDVHSEDFKNLPPEIQHEILTDLKESNRLNSWARLHEMPEESNDFSKFQLERLRKRNVLSARLDDVRKEINIRNSGEIAHILTGSQAAGVVESRKVASEDSSHYILIKGLSKLREEEKRVKLEQGSATLGGDVSGQDSKRMDAEKKILELTREGIDIVDILKTEKDLKKKQGGDGEKEQKYTKIKVEDCQNDTKLNMDESHCSDVAKVAQMNDSVTECDAKVSEPCSSIQEEVIELSDSEEKDHGKKANSVNSDSWNHEKVANKSSESVKNVVTIGSSDEDSIDVVEIVDKETGEVLSVDEDEEMAGGFIREEEEEDSDEERENKKDNKAGSVQTRNDEESSHYGVVKTSPNVFETTSENSTQAMDVITEAKMISSSSGAKDTAEIDLTAEDNVQVARSSLTQSETKNGTMDVSPQAGPTTNSSLAAEAAEVPSVAAEDDSSSDEDDFIEIKINPDAVKEDELFPAEMFMTETNASTNKLEQEAGEDSEKGHEEVKDQDEVISLPEDDVEPSQDDDVIMPDDLQVVNDANEFDGMSREELVELQDVLISESSQLNQERGRQQRMASSVTEQMTLEAQELLQLFGVPFIISPMEAEAQCAFLDLTNQAQGSITDDSDIWLFGGLRVYKNFFNQSKHVEFFKLEDIGRHLLLTKEKLISLALVCGSDYTEGVEGLGPVHGIEILQEFAGEGMEALRNFKKWWDGTRKQLMPPVETKLKGRLRKIVLGDGFPSQEVFDAYLNPEVDDSTEKFSWGKPDLDLLRHYTKHKFGWNKSKTDEVLLPVMKQVNANETQQHITSFFMPNQLETEPRKLKSKRVKRVLTRLRNNDEETERPASSSKDNSRSEPKNGRGKRGRGRGQARGKSRGNKTVPKSSRNTTVDLSESSSDDERTNGKVVRPDIVNLSESDSDSNGDDVVKKSVLSSVKRRPSGRTPVSARGGASKRAKRK